MIKKLDIEAELIISDNGNWTLSTRLSDMLSLAESKYGPRDRSYTIVGIEFDKNGPNIWYPGDRNHICIKLTESCLNNMAGACYQLAHECIHLLSPSGRNATNILEEGLATHFSRTYVKDKFNADFYEDIASYKEAREACEKLLNLQDDIIYVLRQKQPEFRLITKQDIIDVNSNCPLDLAKELTSPFKR